MKKILFALFVISVFASSCKMCVKCSTGTYGAPETEYCKGDVYYNAAKNGTLTDYSGQELKCY